MIGNGFKNVIAGNSRLLWRNRGKYIDEIKDFRSSGAGVYANRFKKENDEIVKEKDCKTIQEAIEFLDS